jgi:NTE family protein
LIFLHQNGDNRPKDTLTWIQRLDTRQFLHLRQDNEKDYRRLSRFLTRRTIGLACGGGGAKGIAHVGVFKAFRELGLEVDMIGGTSIGSIMGATQALDWSQEKLTKVAHQTFVEENIANDYHLPFYSLLRGRKKENIIKHNFSYQIEDLWYNFLCVSCDLSTNRQCTHEQGSLWEAVTASSAMPGVFPPLIQDGHFLVDGALVNNLPGDLLKERGCEFLINIDVSNTREIYSEASHFPSAWQTLLKKIIPGKRKKSRFPGLFKIFMRSSYLPSLNHSQEVNALADIALLPPVRKIGLMGWNKMDEAIKIGYEHTMSYFEDHPEKLQAWREMQGPIS